MIEFMLPSVLTATPPTGDGVGIQSQCNHFALGFFVFGRQRCRGVGVGILPDAVALILVLLVFSEHSVTTSHSRFS